MPPLGSGGSMSAQNKSPNPSRSEGYFCHQGALKAQTKGISVAAGSGIKVSFTKREWILLPFKNQYS